MKIGVVQSEINLADARHNLASGDRGVRSAFEQGAEIILLPEFFNSGIALSRAMLDIPGRQTETFDWLRGLAKELGIPIGGSMLTFDGTDAHNTFVLMFPDGASFTHCKDIPTMVENAFYVGGNDIGVLETPIGRIGVALCWEMIRWETVRRMAGRIDFAFAASCWWGYCPASTSPDNPLHLRSIELLVNAPRDLARLLGVPVAHASSVGPFTAARISDPDAKVTRCFLGHSQIVDAGGIPVAGPIVSAAEKAVEAVVVANLPKKGTPADRSPREDDYWIPVLTEAHLKNWEIHRELGKKYYASVSLPYYSRHTR